MSSDVRKVAPQNEPANPNEGLKLLEIDRRWNDTPEIMPPSQLLRPAPAGRPAPRLPIRRSDVHPERAHSIVEFVHIPAVEHRSMLGNGRADLTPNRLDDEDATAAARKGFLQYAQIDTPRLGVRLSLKRHFAAFAIGGSTARLQMAVMALGQCYRYRRTLIAKPDDSGWPLHAASPVIALAIDHSRSALAGSRA
jgi:hypothetical protein